jgi:two-component system C4-dicarboxylate transport sensor histidine kinase DctB
LKRGTVRVLGWSVSLVVIAVSAAVAHRLALQAGVQRLADAAQHRLAMVAAQLDAEQARFDYLPSLLELTPSVRALLQAPQDAELRDEVNRYLNGINATAGAANLYVLDAQGMALAASDWDSPGTPVGTDLSFRPYVREALAVGQGRFYGVGITSRRAGYFRSYALRFGGRPQGVATVKVDLEQAEREWATLPGAVVVADERKVVILSTHPEWKYRPLAALPEHDRAEIARMQPYGQAALVPLAWVPEAASRTIRIATTDYLASTRLVNGGRWQLYVLDELQPARWQARLVALTAALASSLLALLVLAWWQYQRGIRQKLAAQAALQAAHDSLESKVVERTAELRRAQSELIHAEKMAALGQMSAGMVHELSQPLGAMRTLSDNAGVLLEQQRTDDVRGNLERISRLVDRLGRLTHQLKAFAYKSQQSLAAVPVRQAIANAQLMVAQRLRQMDVALQVEVQPTGLAALAEEARLEQVLTNLMGNALDAMADVPHRALHIQACAQAERCVITLTDTGPGIREDVLPRLFEPFVTTKPAGAGLGLGLMISAHIVRDFGGRLTAANQPGAGARFTIELPLATPARGDTDHA